MRTTNDPTLCPARYLPEATTLPALIILLVVTLLAGACGSGGDSSATTASVAPTTATTTSTTPTTAATTAPTQPSSTENPDSTTSSVLEEADDIARALVQFAQGEDLAIENIQLAEEVVLVLHDQVDRTATAAELQDRSAWTIDSDGYAGFVGPFSALSAISDGPEITITVGPHPHCAGPALQPPAGFEDHTQISIQPAEGSIDSCIAWYAVDLFYDDEAETVDAISLALFGP